MSDVETFTNPKTYLWYDNFATYDRNTDYERVPYPLPDSFLLIILEESETGQKKFDKVQNLTSRLLRIRRLTTRSPVP